MACTEIKDQSLIIDGRTTYQVSIEKNPLPQDTHSTDTPCPIKEWLSNLQGTMDRTFDCERCGWSLLATATITRRQINSQTNSQQ